MLGRFQPFFFPRKSKKESFQTALSYITNRIADLAIASEKTSIPSETIVEVIQGIMEKTDNILKDGFPRHELKQWRERLYRQLLDFIAYNDIIDISSNDSVAKLLESKLKWYYKLTEKDYALSSKGAKIVHSTPSKIRQQSRYWLARIASLLDPAIRTTILRYPKGPETILSVSLSC